jgi:hypothetical protein
MLCLGHTCGGVAQLQALDVEALPHDERVHRAHVQARQRVLQGGPNVVTTGCWSYLDRRRNCDHVLKGSCEQVSLATRAELGPMGSKLCVTLTPLVCLPLSWLISSKNLLIRRFSCMTTAPF